MPHKENYILREVAFLSEYSLTYRLIIIIIEETHVNAGSKEPLKKRMHTQLGVLSSPVIREKALGLSPLRPTVW